MKKCFILSLLLCVFNLGASSTETMKPTYIAAIIRHGRSPHNVIPVYSYQTAEEGGRDPFLIEGQEEEAKKVADSLIAKGFGEAPIWCSPLQRAQDTAQLLQKAGLKGEIITKQELREIKAGILEGQPVPNTEGLSVEETWMAHTNYAHEHGGESFEDVSNRIRPIADELMSLTEPVVIVTHGTPSRALIRELEEGNDICLSQWGYRLIQLD